MINFLQSMKRVVPLICFLMLTVCIFTASVSGGEIPDSKARIKCPVCGMFVTKYSDWLASVRFKDGYTAFFDGPKDMFKYLFNVKKYDPSRNRGDVTAIKVTDYYSVSRIDAQKAWYVLGSDVFGPMGRELIPLQSKADAEEFMRDHAGKTILRFNDVTDQVIKTLD